MIIVIIKSENILDGLKKQVYQIERMSLLLIDKLVDDFEERYPEYRLYKKEICWYKSI